MDARGLEKSMDGRLARIDVVLARIERLAGELEADPDHRVLRSANELREAFGARRAIEPAVARVRDGVHMLRSDEHEDPREFQRPAHDVDRLVHVMDWELLPELRRVGFNV